MRVDEINTEVLKSFYQNKTSDNSLIFIIKEYEIFVKNNFKKGSADYNQLLAFLSFYKYISYEYIYLEQNQESNLDLASKKNWDCMRRSCFDCCMNSTISSYFDNANFVD